MLALFRNSLFKVSFSLCGILIAFYLYPFVGYILGGFSNSDAFNQKYFNRKNIGAKFTEDDSCAHPIFRENLALVNLNKDILKPSECCSYIDKTGKSDFGKSYNSSILFVRQLLNNKDPPEGGVS
jgi:hypothetical protein